MTTNQWRAFILAVLGFAPAATAGTGVIWRSDHHMMILTAFLVGLLGFVWLIGQRWRE